MAGTQGTLCPARRPAYKQELFRRLERYCQGWREFPPMEGPAPELWDLYDKDRNPLGRTIERGAPLPPGAYHLAVQIVPLDASGQVLLTRRADSKPKYPGFWEVPGAAPKRGRTPPPPPAGSFWRRPASPPSRRSWPCWPSCCSPPPTWTCTPSPKTSPSPGSPSSPARPAPPSTSPWRSGWPKWAAATTCPQLVPRPGRPPSPQTAPVPGRENVILQHKERTPTWHIQ